MAQQTIITYSSAEYATMPDVHFDIREGKNFVEYLNRIFGEASYPDVHPDHLLVKFSFARVQEVVNQIFGRALTDALTSHAEIIDITANALCRKNEKTGKMCVFFASAKLTTVATMDETAAKYALAHSIDVDAANLAVERELTTMAYGFANYCEAVVDIHPISKAWHDMKRDNPDRFYEIATEAYKHYGKKLWMGAWSEAHSEVENFLHWVMKNHPDIDLFTQEIGMNPDPAALPAAPTATNEPTANTNNQTTTPTPMAKTANTNIPAGYKVAPAAEPTNSEAIASQFAPQFEKALSAVSPSGAKLADCELVWSATTRPNDLPGRIITCKVVENEQTWHTFTFDCKDRHRDSTTYDEGMKFDWLSVDAMIKAFTRQASVLDCVKEGCKKRLTGGASATPKAQTKSEPQTAAPAAPQPAEGAAAPTEATAPAPMPKANTKSAPTAAPQTSQPQNLTTSQPQTPQTPSVFQTYECSATPAFYYHLYGEGENSGIVVIHRETGEVRQHCANQTMESSRSLIKQHGMTEVQPIPTVVITALIKEGVIKAPLSINHDQTAEKAAAEKAAKEQREREEREAAERAEQERIAKEQAEREAAEERKRKEAEAKAKREAEERAKREAAEKAKREEEERKRKEAEEEAKRKAEEEEAKKRAEEEKREAEERAEQERQEQLRKEAEEAAAKAKTASIAPKEIRHEMFEEVLDNVRDDEPVYLFGPAGTGKNVLLKQIADELGLKFYFNNAVQNSFDETGYGDAYGKFVETEFYRAFTEGGLYMLDEMDASVPEVLNIMNAAIANRYFTFPVVGRIDAHPDFRIVAAGNTIGTGADSNYTGRCCLDAATLNRFVKIPLGYSHRIEMAITNNDGEMVEFMEALREAVKNARFDVVLSYRQTRQLMKYIKRGKYELAYCIRRTCLPTQSLDDIRIIAENIMTSGHNKYTAALKQLCEKMRRDQKYAA